MILHNEQGMNGQATTAVAVSFPFWQELMAVAPECGMDRSLYHVTRTDIDLMLLLHKVCNTNGVIRETKFHRIAEAAGRWFEKPASRSQLYMSLDKFIARGLVHRYENDITGETTYQLNHFAKDDGTPHRYVALSPVVFAEKFSQLTLAARKLFLLTAMQQGNNSFIFRNIRGDRGLMHLLNKNQANQVQACLNELTEASFLRVSKLEYRKGAAHKAYLAVPQDMLINADGERLREPLDPPERYPRKAAFIRRVLQQLGIGELEQDMNLLINTLKSSGHRLIRQILRRVLQHAQYHGFYPKHLAHFLKKEARQVRENRIIDLAYEAGIGHYIVNPGEDDPEQRLFTFANHFSWYNDRELKAMFRAASDSVTRTYLPTDRYSIEAYTAVNDYNESVFVRSARNMAWAVQLNPEVYRYHEQQLLNAVDSDARFYQSEGDFCDFIYELADGTVKAQPQLPLEQFIEFECDETLKFQPVKQPAPAI
ncbi:hypothetical protein B0H94_1206 [Salsuginibacillus halophilus]|uniref:Uncharacterized protein n=1 Tax=Salsuginibacillus halophilus TaxID=517424 RepID=A0A2P8H4Y9_9BACI|nr:hypothetical protein [Salsuginibacillus halophilus]PSL41260.1 hypothetical protein B0H94_1206 [Salsuginibacillus halophilus]